MGDRAVGLELRGVSADALGRPVLRGVSLDVPAGAVVGFFGPSGAGKSTLLEIAAGERAAREGRVALDGRDLGDLELWQRARLGLGYLPQGPSVLWDLSLGDNLRSFAAAVTRSGRRPRDVSELVERLMLSPHRRTLARALSGGERRRLEIARVLVGAPRVILADEPFSGMDPRSAEIVGRILVEEARAGAGVLLADHHVALALPLCDVAHLLDGGEILVSGTPEALAASEAARRVYLGDAWPRRPRAREDSDAGAA